MILQRNGEVVPGFHALGPAEVPCYLVEAERPALFDAGFSCLGPLYAQEARRVLGQRPPDCLYLTHAHFDHCGAAAYIKGAFPGLEIAASRRAAEIIQRPGALSLIQRLNQEAAQTVATWEAQWASGEEFQPFTVDRVLEDGQEIDLGGGHILRVLSTPGHTWDFLTYHLPGAGILICSEAAGCAYPGGQLVTEFLVDYQRYLENVEMLLSLQARVLCQGHRLIYLGQDEVRGFLERSLAAARRYRAWVDELLDQEHGQVERVVELVKAAEYDPHPHPKQPEPAYLINTTVRVKHLAGLRQAGEPAPGEGA